MGINEFLASQCCMDLIKNLPDYLHSTRSHYVFDLEDVKSVLRTSLGLAHNEWS